MPTPVYLVQNTGLIFNIAIDGQYVYWADFTNGTINRVLQSGAGGNQVIATAQSRTIFLTVDANNVYWSNNQNTSPGGVFQMPKAGGPITTIVGHSPSSEPYGVFVDSTTIYWADGGTNDIYSAPIGGGTITTLATGQSKPFALTGDNTNLYWVNEVNVGTGQVQQMAKTGGSITTLATGTQPWALCIDANNVYWVTNNATNDSVNQVPIGGGTNTVLSSGYFGLGGVTVGAGQVFFSYSGSSRLLSVPIGGGPVSTVASSPYTLGVEGLATNDGNTVFWGNFFSSSDSAVVYVPVTAAVIVGGSNVTGSATNSVLLGGSIITADSSVAVDITDTSLIDASLSADSSLSVSVGINRGVAADLVCDSDFSLFDNFFTFMLADSGVHAILFGGSTGPFVRTTSFFWVQETNTPMIVPFSSFAGEVHGDILGDLLSLPPPFPAPPGLLFFSPALNEAAANSIIQVEEVSACSLAYDEYRFPPEPPFGQPFYTYGGGAPGHFNQSVLWGVFPALGEAQITVTFTPLDLVPHPQDTGCTITVAAPFAVGYVAFLNDPGFLIYDDSPAPVPMTSQVGTSGIVDPSSGLVPPMFITAYNLAPIPVGPMMTYDFLFFYGDSEVAATLT